MEFRNISMPIPKIRWYLCVVLCLETFLTNILFADMPSSFACDVGIFIARLSRERWKCAVADALWEIRHWQEWCRKSFQQMAQQFCSTRERSTGKIRNDYFRYR